MIKNFFNRNKPIFLIGALTLIVFVVIIFLSTKKKTQQPELVKIIEEPKYTVTQENQEDLDQLEDVLREVFEISESEDVTPENIFDKHMGILVVEYKDEDGFSPKNTRIIQKQLARWENKSDHTITIVQKTNKYDELKDGKILEPGEWFELRLEKTGLFTYSEKESGALGSIYVFEPDFD